jgi:glutathione synthase/RimK-type ligase-like ATP-grasp enzyme
MRLHLALATCSELPDGDPDDAPLVDALRARGVSTTWVVWDDPCVNLDRFDAVLLRSTWDYQRRRQQFLAWCRTARRLLNPIAMVAWSTDKSYLVELAAAGIGVVPTRAVQPGEVLTARLSDEFVVKPNVSAGSKDTARFRAHERDRADALVREIADSGRQALVQPYLSSVDTRGESAVIYVDGAYSHTIRKGPLLTPGGAPTDGLFAAENIILRSVTAAEKGVAERCIEHVKGRFGTPLYARVDLVEDASGTSLVLELELAEPSLFLGFEPAAADALARAVERAVGAAGWTPWSSAAPRASAAAEAAGRACARSERAGDGRR